MKFLQVKLKAQVTRSLSSTSGARLTLKRPRALEQLYRLASSAWFSSVLSSAFSSSAPGAVVVDGLVEVAPAAVTPARPTVVTG